MIACLKVIQSPHSNNYGHTTKNDGVCFNQSLHLENSSNLQTIRGMLHQLMDPREEYIENYRCADGCQMLNTSTMVVYVTQLSDALIIQVNTFKYVNGISNKFFPTQVLTRNFLFGEIEWYSLVFIFHGKEQSHCGHYTSGVKVENTWFLISGKRILMQRKPRRNSKDISVAYILIYEKITNFLRVSPISLNGTAEAGPTSELITEIAEIVI